MSEYTFHSTRPFDAQSPLPALAVYCSDGRFASACEQFIENHLGIERCDQLVIPGGPGALVEHGQDESEAETMVDNLRFLTEAHKLDRLVLIIHDQCGFYLHRLGFTETELLTQQQRDLAEVVRRIRSLTRISRIETYRAAIVDDHVAFSVVAVD